MSIEKEYNIESISAYAERENNSKRRNLIVNKLQGKHFPVSPSDSLALFGALAERIDTLGIPNKNILVIGFAETATAIGAEVASQLGNGCRYIHTTREPDLLPFQILDFSEEHSHATEQNLCSPDGKDIFKDTELVIFVEDELTTGKTILNFVNVLKPFLSENCRFCASSIINGMSEENLAVYKENSIDLAWLIKTDDSSKDMNKVIEADFKDDEVPKHICNDISVIEISDYPDPRICVDASEYSKFCDDICEKLRHEYPALFSESKPLSIDVIGTEECMFPAIRLGKALEALGLCITTHSTTRSPIRPSETEGYPLFSRYRLESFYESQRKTFIYNLYSCDAVILVTDSEPSDECLKSFADYTHTQKLTVIKLKRK